MTIRLRLVSGNKIVYKKKRQITILKTFKLFIFDFYISIVESDYFVIYHRVSSVHINHFYMFLN